MTIYLPTFRHAALVAAAVVLCSCGGGSEPPVSALQAPAAQAGVVRPMIQASPKITGNVATAIQVFQTFTGQAPSYSMLTAYTTQAASNAPAFAASLASGYANITDANLALMVLNNLGVTASSVTAVNAQGQSEYALLLDAVTQMFTYYGPAARGQIMLNATRLLANLESDATYGPVAVNYNNQTWLSFNYATNPVNDSATVMPVATANAGMARSVLSGASVALDASASAAAPGSTLSYAWTLASKPDGSAAALTNASAVNASFVPDQVGTYVANVTVSDGTVTSGAASVRITAAQLRDTGINTSQCYGSGSNTLASCSGAAALALNSAQDGMLGRDVSSASNTDGKLGFSFSAVGSYATTECVMDNLTGLVWEGKTALGDRASTNSYSNYGDSRSADASAYVAAVNAAKLCGYSNWRLPTSEELHALVDYSVVNPDPNLDMTWFPNGLGAPYWTASAYLGSTAKAWSVNFANGYVSSSARSAKLPVRLVR